MTKKEVKTVENGELIMETILTYSSLVSNYQLGRGTTQHAKHLYDLAAELLKRGILNQSQINRLYQ